jgi:hypothetical protein
MTTEPTLDTFAYIANHDGTDLICVDLAGLTSDELCGLIPDAETAGDDLMLTTIARILDAREQAATGPTHTPRPLTDGNLPHVGQEVALAGPRPGTGSDHGRYVGQTNGVPVFYFAETSREEFVPKSDEITWVAR